MSEKKLKNLLDNNNFNGLVKARHGYLIYNKKDIYIGRAIEKYGEFSELETQLFQQICQAGDVVLDIGANIGAHTLAMSNFVGATGKVYAFEPQPIIFQTLCANMAINSVTNVSCHCIALSDRAGHVLVPDINYDVEGNFGGVAIEQFDQGQRIPKVALDDFLSLPKLKLIKIDVEGMEQEVINGAKKLIAQHQPVIYMENDRRDKSKDLIELMWSLGYKMFWHRPTLFNPNNYAQDSENIYQNTVSVNMLCFPKTAKTQLTGFTEVDDSSFHPHTRS